VKLLLRKTAHLLRHPVSSLDDWWSKVSPERRLDHNLDSICMLVGLALPALSIVLIGPAPTTTVADMSPNLQIAMCACIFGGCVMKLHGVFSHTRFWFPNTPIRRCYQIGYSAAPAATAGLLVYGWFLVTNTETWLSAVGAVLPPMLGFGIGLQSVMYWLEARRIERVELHMIRKAQADA
jgi:hypothetical protein